MGLRWPSRANTGVAIWGFWAGFGNRNVHVYVYTIPASSSPWSDTSATTNKVHYAGNTTNGANYTWYTATASTRGSDYSICPRGWRLPKKSEYDTLASKKTGSWNSGWTLAGAFFPAADRVFGGSLGNVGSGGFYWSSTAYDINNAYDLNFNSGYVSTNGDGRYLGFSVRCIAP